MKLINFYENNFTSVATTVTYYNNILYLNTYLPISQVYENMLIKFCVFYRYECDQCPLFTQISDTYLLYKSESLSIKIHTH